MDIRIKKIPVLLLMSVIMSIYTLPGCGSVNNASLFTKPVIAPEVITYRAWYPNRTVCVLPFENLSTYQDADIKVREVFVTELFLANIFQDMVDLVEANAALMSLRIRKPYPLDKETIRALGERLGADYLIFGIVTEYGYGKGKEYGSEMGLSVRMIDAGTGNILWSAYNFKMGTNSLSRIFGISQGPTPMELTREVVAQIVAALEYEIAQQQRLSARGQGRSGGLFGGSRESEGYENDYEYRR